MEAAAIDGAGPWQRFRDVTLPMLKPILLILTALSVLWDFRVFTQIYVLQKAGRHHPRHQPARRLRLPDLDRREPLRHRRRGRRRHGGHHAAADGRLPAPDGRGRRSCVSTARRRRAARRDGRCRDGGCWLNLVGLAVFVVFAFPVYWMVQHVVPAGLDVQPPDPAARPDRRARSTTTARSSSATSSGPRSATA